MHQASQDGATNKRSSPDRNGAVIIDSVELSSTSTIRTFLAALASQNARSLTVIQIVSEQGAGQISVVGGHTITGVCTAHDLKTGMDALGSLLQVTTGTLVCYAVQSEPAELNQGLNIPISNITGVKNSLASSFRTDKSWSTAELDSIPSPKLGSQPTDLQTPKGLAVQDDIERSWQKHQDSQVSSGPQFFDIPAIEQTDSTINQSGRTQGLAQSSDRISKPRIRPSMNTPVDVFPKVSSAHMPAIKQAGPSAPTPKEFNRAGKAIPAVDNILVMGAIGSLALSLLLACQVIGAVNSKEQVSNGLEALKKGNNVEALLAFTSATNTNPAITPAYLYRAIAESRLGHFDKAIADFTHVLENDPKNIEALTGRACMELKKKNYDPAAADCEATLKINPLTPEAYRIRAMVSAKTNNYQQALLDCDYYLKYFSKKAEKREIADVLTTRALAHLKTKKYTEAIDDYNKAIALDENNGYLYASRAAAFKGASLWKSALADCNRAIPIIATPSSLFRLRALCYAQLGESAKSVKDINRALEATPKSVELHRMRARQRWEMQDFAGALNDYRFVLEENPSDSEARTKYAQACKLVPHSVIEANEREPEDVATKNSGAKVNEKTKQRPQDEDASSGAAIDQQALVAEGYELLKRGHSGQAIAHLTSAVKADPNDATARLYLAHALAASGNTKPAILQFQACNSLKPLDCADLLTYGNLLEGCGHPQAAMDAYDHAIRSNPDNSAARIALIELYAKSSKIRQAKSLAEASIARAHSQSERDLYMTKLKNALRKAEPAQIIRNTNG